MKRQTSLLIALTIVGILGCEQKGTMEKAGERADEVVDNVKEGQAPFHKKGFAEKTGEAIDKSVASVTKSSDE